MTASTPSNPSDQTRAFADFAFGSQTHVADASRPLAWLSPEELNIDLSDPVQRRFGDYELIERIGQGGMGVVYRARQHGLERDVAIKLLAAGPWASEEFVARFRREARSAARMQHPNIVEIYEFGHREGLNYFSMRLIEGPSLAQRLAKNGPMPARDAAKLLRILAEAMDYAHRLGVLHLDLKPANILLTAGDEPLIADFGLARRIDAGHEGNAGEISGTPSYMAPEQAMLESHPLSASTDIYGLGAILYEMLTGHPPFQAADAQATLERVITEAPKSPGSLCKYLSPDLEAICLKCLEKEPKDRYASSRVLADDLGRFLESRPVAVRPLNAAQRAHRWTKREPRTAIAIAMAMLALLSGLTASLWQWQRAESARGVAEAQRNEAVKERSKAVAQKTIAETQIRRLRQAMGLMGILAPDDPSASAAINGPLSTTNAADQAQIDKAVIWLEKHASEADQAEILMAYRNSLADAGKPMQADALVTEVLNRLILQYVQHVIADLTSLDTAESLAWASRLAPVAADGDRLALEAVKREPGNRFALYAAGARCPENRKDPCPVPDAWARLAKIEPDNAFILLQATLASRLSPQELLTALQPINAASRFDDYSRASYTNLSHLMQQVRTPIPGILTGAAWKSLGEETSAGTEMDTESLFNMEQVVPQWYTVVRACHPGLHPNLTSQQRTDCVALGLRAARSFGIPLTHNVGQSIVRRLAKGTPLEVEMEADRRRYLWMNEQLNAISPARVADIDHDRKREDFEQYGEDEALSRMLERVGIARDPPANWQPKDPNMLLLPEDQKPKSAAKQ